MYTEQDYAEYVAMMETLYPQMFANPYGGFCVGSGWWPIISVLCHNIQLHIDQQNSRRKYLLENNPDHDRIPDEVPQVTAAQIKEKFGGLRFYYDGGDDYISGMVTMAEAMASRTCEECGKPGKQRDGGWIRTLCDEHEAERQEQMNKRNNNDT
jgi:hypothetical protein